tara:strand:- start:398 stop:595 length:198 start_codon:yes stop_codon:yes gene_type:complete
MNIKLTNGKKTITRSKEQYEANINHFAHRGFKPINLAKENTKNKEEKSVDKVVQLKPKKKTRKKK